MKFRQNTRNSAKFRIFAKKKKIYFRLNPNYRPVKTRRYTYGWPRTEKACKVTRVDDLGPYGCDAALVWWRWDDDARAPIVLLQSGPVANSRQWFSRSGSTKNVSAVCGKFGHLNKRHTINSLYIFDFLKNRLWHVMFSYRDLLQHSSKM